MQWDRTLDAEVPSRLVKAIRSLPVHREVTHCGASFQVSPFDFYAVCPRCGTRMKVRSFSGGAEIEDVFDAVFEWMSQPGADQIARQRQQEIQQDREP